MGLPHYESTEQQTGTGQSPLRTPAQTLQSDCPCWPASKCQNWAHWRNDVGSCLAGGHCSLPTGRHASAPPDRSLASARLLGRNSWDNDCSALTKVECNKRDRFLASGLWLTTMSELRDILYAELGKRMADVYRGQLHKSFGGGP